MTGRRTGVIVMVLLLGIQALMLDHYYELLPPRVAQHFGGGGRPTSFVSREVFYGFVIGMSALMVLSFHATSLLIPGRMLRKLRVPSYWQAPERRAQTVVRVQANLIALGNACLLFVLWATHRLILINLNPPPRLAGSFLLWTAGFVIVMIVWVVRMQRGFRAPDR